MTSLSDAYQRGGAGVANPRRLYAGMALLLVGAALAIGAVVVGTTDLFASYLADELAARKAAGTLGGLSVPTVLVGVFTVLPNGRRIRAAAAISASICLVGVALFWYAYPAHWAGFGRDLTFFVSAVYFVGLFTAISCLFIAVVNFKTRNDPGGALNMTVTRGETRVVEAEPDDSGGLGGLGGVGFLGATPDGDVETQTGGNGGAAASPSPSAGASAAGDGGSTTQDIRSPVGAASGDRPEAPGDGRDAVVLDDAGDRSPSEPADRYCGNCTHFEYVRDDDGMVPYCRYRGEGMANMDACEEWTPNARR